MMIQCPKCGNFCLDNDPKCPSCGAPLATQQMQKYRVIILALCGVVGVLALTLVAFLIFKGSDRTRTSPEIEEDRGYYSGDSYGSRNYRSSNDVIVYCNSADGFLNIRETPSSKGRILGKFRNGPHGAVYLGESGNWTEIDCNGLVGYVYTANLSYTPTKEVTVDIDEKWLMGPWYPSNKEYAYLIFNNGTYTVQYYYGTIAYGRYHLEGDEIVFETTMLRSGLGFPVSTYERFRINLSPKRIGHLTKRALVKEDDLWKYSGELVWTWAQYNELKKEIRRYVGK